MLQLKLVKGYAENDHDDSKDVNYGDKDNVPYGTKVMLKLLSPWMNT